MGFEFLDVMFRGICVGVAASITVGPVAVLCIQRTLSKSRRSGIVSGLGVACADTFMAMAALFFYSMLIRKLYMRKQIICRRLLLKTFLFHMMKD